MRRLLVLAMAAALGLTACGGDAKGRLVSAFEETSGAGPTSVVMTVLLGEGTISALENEGTPPAVIDAIVDSSITISGTPAQDPNDATSEVTINISGDDAIQFMQSEGVLYLRADVRGLFERFGGDPRALDRMAKGGRKAGLDFAGPALNGEWIAIPGLNELGESMGVASPDPEAQQEFLDEIKEAFEDNAEVRSEGDEEPGEHLVADIPLRDTLEPIFESVSELAGMPPTLMPPTSEIPEESITVDIWVNENAEITQVEFDLLQVQKFETNPEDEIPEEVDTLAIRMTVSDWDGEIDVPTDAIEVNPNVLLQLMMGSMMEGFDSAAGSASSG